MDSANTIIFFWRRKVIKKRRRRKKKLLHSICQKHTVLSLHECHYLK